MKQKSKIFGVHKFMNNKKGVLGERPAVMIVLFVLLGLMAVLGVYFLMTTNETGERITELGECERGVEGMYGMCSPVPCEATGGDAIISILKSCPSTRTRLAMQIKNIPQQEASKYKHCCIVEHCTDITDRGEPRIAACFATDPLKKEDLGDYSHCEIKEHAKGYFEKECLGYAKDCLPEDNCCCVMPDPKLS